MVSPRDSTSLSNKGYTQAAAYAAKVDTSTKADTAGAISSAKKSQELAAPHQEGSVRETPQQAKELWSPLPSITG